MNENTTEGPLTATVGERLGEKAHLVAEALDRRQTRLRAERRFPWTALLAAAAVWMLVRGLTGLTRGTGRRLRLRR